MPSSRHARVRLPRLPRLCLSRLCLSLPCRLRRAALVFVALALAIPSALLAQLPLDAFHWVNFHDPKDEPTIAWVKASLQTEKWTRIDEIGVQFDSALVLTSYRESPQSNPPSDLYTVWSVGLAKKQVQPLLRLYNPRILNWTAFSGQYAPELALIFDDCYDCTATTSFTSLYYSLPDHAWRARWLHGNAAAPLHSQAQTPNVEHTEVYGLLTDYDGRQILGKWDHFDYGKARPADDFLYQYSVNPVTGLDQTQLLADPHAAALELRLCQIDPQQGDPALAPLIVGQQSDLCQKLLHSVARPARHLTLTPPANNQGRSATQPHVNSKPQPGTAHHSTASVP